MTTLDRTDSPDLLSQRLRTLVVRLRRRLQDASSVGDLTAPQASALARLLLTEPSSASQLAGAERVRPQSMAATLAGLHDRGLLRREPDPADARRQLLFLTDTGRALARGARTTREEWLRDSFATAYDDDERRVIAEALRLLDRLVEE